MFASERLLLYKHGSDIPQSSPAEIRKATPGNIRDVLFFDTPDKVEKYLNFLELGDRGYLGYLDGNCVHRSWVKCGPGVVWLHWSLPLSLKENEAYIHFCETAPQSRGKNIFSHMLCHISEELKHCKNIYICINVNNPASIRSVEKAGFMLMHRYRIVAFLNRLIYKRKDE
jgi:ribosomal protein S18 acetylase RimI-like enzyme